MSFFQLKNNSMTDAVIIPKKSIKELGFEEGKVRDLVAQQIHHFFPDLKTIATEFSDWEDSGRRPDILAIDRELNLVVIELKRDKDAAHAELQALRYAALVSVCRFENILDQGLKYRKQFHPACTELDYKQEIMNFVGCSSEEEIVFSDTPRIILISSAFSKEITTTVMWLNAKFEGMDISCYEVAMYALEGGFGLHFDQIIPIAKAHDYQVKARAKNLEATQQASLTRRERTVSILDKAAFLTPGTQIYAHAKFSSKFDIEDEGMKFATYLGKGRFKWGFDDAEYASVNALTGAIFEHFGEKRGSLQCPVYWRRVGSEVSLAKEADQIQDTNLV